MGTEADGIGFGRQNEATVGVALEARPERRLIEPGGGARYVALRIQVSHSAGRPAGDRTPLTLALVLDRSGSMQGDKLQMAKHAALSVLDQLDERDRVAIVVFDDQIDTIQPPVPVTSDIKAHARAALARIEARASTALHEGWLTGCNAIVEDGQTAAGRGLARCFVLTDGLANVGVTDPEQISSQAGGIRHKAGIGTSTFGIGEDYNETLLAQVAAAGGGEFYHLRTPAEITQTFIGELGELLGVAAGNVRLEFETIPGTRLEVISAYHLQPADGSRWSLPVGDLLSGEERHIIVRFTFPAHDSADGPPARARVVWTANGTEHRTEWQQVPCEYADSAACAAERPDPDVSRLIWRDRADETAREALRQSQRGDWRGAQAMVRETARALYEAAGDDAELQARLSELQLLEQELERGPLPSLRAKEAYYQAQSRSHGKSTRDFRKPTS